MSNQRAEKTNSADSARAERSHHFRVCLLSTRKLVLRRIHPLALKVTLFAVGRARRTARFARPEHCRHRRPYVLALISGAGGGLARGSSLRRHIAIGADSELRWHDRLAERWNWRAFVLYQPPCSVSRPAGRCCVCEAEATEHQPAVPRVYPSLPIVNFRAW